jgi:hypothetical protein
MPGRRRPISLDAALSNALFVLLFLTAGFALIWDGLSVPLVTYAAFTDYWEHTATLTEWMRDLWQPENPHVASADLSSRFMPYFWVLSGIGQLFGLTAVQLMSLSLVINFCLITLGINLFFRSYFRDPWAPLAGFVAIFMLWGLGWNWSNLLQFRSFIYVGGYPSAFVFGLSLVAFWATLRMLRQDGSIIILGALLALLGVLMLLCHPLTAVFGIFGCALLALTEKSVPAVLRVNVLGMLIVAGIVAEIWPHFSVWKLMLGNYGAGVENWPALRDIDPLSPHLFYQPGIVLTMLGPALLGLPVLVWLWFKREHRFIVWGALLMAVPYALNLFFQIPLAHRFLLFVAFYLQLALVWAALTLLVECRAEPKPAYGAAAIWSMTAMIIVLIGGNVALVASEYRGESIYAGSFEVRDKRAVLPPGQNVLALYEAVTAPLADDAVVLTTASLGWPLPTVKGKVVSLYHENPLLLDQRERYMATADFFYRPIDPERRTQIVDEYGATHMLVSDRDPNIKPVVGEWLDLHGELVAEVDNYRMYRIRDNLPRIVAAPEPQPTVAARLSEPAVLRTAQVDALGPAVPAEALRPEAAVAEPPAAEARHAEPAASFGAPIASPIVNLPEADAGKELTTLTQAPSSPAVEGAGESADIEASAPPAEALQD